MRIHCLDLSFLLIAIIYLGSLFLVIIDGATVDVKIFWILILLMYLNTIFFFKFLLYILWTFHNHSYKLIHMEYDNLYSQFFRLASMLLSMTSLLPHIVAQPTKWRFLPLLSQLFIFVIELALTRSWVNKNHQNLIFKVNFSMSKINFISF